MAEQLPSYALTTVARIKARLSITASTFDDLFLRMIASASDFIEGQCNRRFKQTSHTEIKSFRIVRPDMIFLKQRPVVSITSLKYRVGLFNDPNYTAIPATDFTLLNDGKEGIIKVEGGWLFEGANVAQVVYLAGYLIDFDNLGDESKHNLPGDITDLCERLVIKVFKRREDEGKDSVSLSIQGGGTTKWLKELTEDDKLTLEKHIINPAFF